MDESLACNELLLLGMSLWIVPPGLGSLPRTHFHPCQRSSAGSTSPCDFTSITTRTRPIWNKSTFVRAPELGHQRYQSSVCSIRNKRGGSTFSRKKVRTTMQRLPQRRGRSRFGG